MMTTLRQLRNQALKATERCTWRYDMETPAMIEDMMWGESSLGWPGSFEANERLTEEREVLMTLPREEIEEYVTQVTKFEELLEQWYELTVGFFIFRKRDYKAMAEVAAEAAEFGLAL